MNRLMSSMVGAGLMLSWVATVQAGVTVTVQEVGTDLVVTADGTLDLSDLSSLGDTPLSGSVGPSGIFVGASGTAEIWLTTAVVEPSSLFGTTGVGAPADSGTGDLFGLSISGTTLLLLAPDGYISGQPLSGTATYTGESLLTLGLKTGSYRWEWEVSFEGATDFFEVVVIAPTSGACCLNGGCLQISSQSCSAAGGQYFGDGSSCTSTTCPAPPITGACCIDGACVQLSNADCASVGGVYNGDASDCVSVVCEAECPADITDAKGNGPDGVVDVFDLLAMLAAWGNCLP